MASGRRAVHVSAVTVGTVLALALLVAAPSITGEPSAEVTYGAPYAIQHLQVHDTVVQNHLGNATLSSKPYFHATTGIGGFAANASIPTCTGACSGEDAIYPATVEFTMPLDHIVPSGGLSTTTTVTFDWTFGWSVDVVYHPGTCTPASVGAYACASTVRWVVQILAESITDRNTHKSYAPEGSSFDNVTGPWGPGGPAWSSTWYNDTGAQGQANGTLEPYTQQALPTAAHFSEKFPTSQAIQLPATRKTNHYEWVFEILWAVQIEVGTQNAELAGFSASLGVNIANARQGDLMELDAITVS